MMTSPTTNTLAPPTLRRSYTLVPGQSDEEHEKMVKRLDEANTAIGLVLSIPPPSTTTTTAPPQAMAQSASGKTDTDTASAASTTPKRSLDSDLMPPPAPRAPKRKRKARITAVEKFIGGEIIYELTLPDSSIILTRPLAFA